MKSVSKKPLWLSGKLALVFVVASICGYGLPQSLASFAQAPLSQSELFLIRVAPSPDGAILKPFLSKLDFELGLFQPVVRQLSVPIDIACSPAGQLYVNENFIQTEQGVVHRLWRFNRDGSGRTLVLEWDRARGSDTVRLSTIALAPNGDLFFGTYSTALGVPSQGIWRVPNALAAGQAFEQPIQVLAASNFVAPLFNEFGITRPVAVLTEGPFKGDLLIVDTPAPPDDLQAPDQVRPVGRVLRALQPNFDRVVEFIPPFVNSSTGFAFVPANAAVTPGGDVLVGDFYNNQVLRYGPDGTLIGVFAEVATPDRLAVDESGQVFVTNLVATPGRPQHGGMFIFDANGQLVAAADFPLRLGGIAACSS